MIIKPAIKPYCHCCKRPIEEESRDAVHGCDYCGTEVETHDKSVFGFPEPRGYIHLGIYHRNGREHGDEWLMFCSWEHCFKYLRDRAPVLLENKRLRFSFEDIDETNIVAFLSAMNLTAGGTE